jgi:hypothetical protein
MEMTVALRDFGSVHTRRSLALVVRRQLEQALEQLPPESSLLIDCTGVRLMSPEYANWALRDLFVAQALGEHGELTLDVTGAEPQVEAVLNGLLRDTDLLTVSATHRTIGG